MAIALKTAVKAICSMPMLAGVGAVAISLGVIPVDEVMASIARVWIGDAIPLKPFLFFLGTSKILSVAKLWGYGPMPSRMLAYVGLGTPAFCAFVGHYKVEGPVESIPPVLYLGLLGAFYHLESKDANEEKSD
mmetsp:Transcript_41570/g.68169  ORF Transcript_41570/g.68169 Transcript_41570/m.68169 type:complete len:133 (-) Transcript_41570:424-822(-)